MHKKRKMHKMFVYGTLRAGESNHGLLKGAVCLSLSAHVSGTMLDTGLGYPAVTEGSGKVWGEMYEVDDDTLKRIDELEDYYGPGDPRNLYERVKTAALTDRGQVQTWIYVSDRFKSGFVIPHGDWKSYRMTGR